MNFIDIAILLVLAITILGGLYRGFVSTALNVCATAASILFGRILIPIVSGIVKGSADLYQLEQALGTDHLMGDEGYISVAGLILNELGRLPKLHEVIERENVSFTVVELEDQRIALLKVVLTPTEMGAESA